MFTLIKKPVSLLVLFSFMCWPIHGYCLPEGEQVVAGSATFDRSQTDTLTVNQSTDRLIANYNSFSIAQPEAVHFNQPNSGSIALNRVVGIDPSVLLGTLTANGRIFLVNPNGVLFGAGARVDTAGLVASTLNIADADFLAGRYSFIGSGGEVVNQGYISAPGGYVALLGSSVVNTGVIEASLGSIALASGNAVTLNLDPSGFINVVVDEETLVNPSGAADAVRNSGTLSANGGKVVLTAQTLDGIFDKAINTDGIIEATAIDDSTGLVVLQANQEIAVDGAIDAEGGEVSIESKGAQLGADINSRRLRINGTTGAMYINSGMLLGSDVVIWDQGDIYVNADITAYEDSSHLCSLTINAGVGPLPAGELGNFYHNSGLIQTTSANSGDITITGNDLLLGDITAMGKFSADARGSISGGLITAPGADLKAVNGIGLSDARVATNVDTLTASVSDGDIYIEEENGVTLENIEATGSVIDIVTNGDTLVHDMSSTGPAPGDKSINLLVNSGNLTVDGTILAQCYGSAPASVNLTAAEGSLRVLSGSMIQAYTTSLADATVSLNAYDELSVEGAFLYSEVWNQGNASIHLNAGSIDILESDIDAYVLNGVEAEVDGGAYVSLYADGGLNLTDSAIQAQVSGYGTSEVWLEGSGVTLEGADIVSHIENGWDSEMPDELQRALVSVSAYEANMNDSNIEASVGSLSSGGYSPWDMSGEAYLSVDTYAGLAVTGESTLRSVVLGNGVAGTYLFANNGGIVVGDETGAIPIVEAYVYGEGIGEDGGSRVYMDAGLYSKYETETNGISLFNTDVLATVGMNGQANIEILARNGPIIVGGTQGTDVIAQAGWGDDASEIDLQSWMGDITIENESHVHALVDYDGDAEVYIYPREGNVNIVDSEVVAHVGGDGFAGVFFQNYEESDEFNSPFGTYEINYPFAGDINISGDKSLILAEAGSLVTPATAVVVMNTFGNINLDAGMIAAQEVNGESGIALLAKGDINTAAGSTISASSENGPVGVALLAGGLINTQGLVSAASLTSVAGILMQSGTDLIAANVVAAGGADLIGLAESWLSDYFCSAFDIGAQYTYGGAVLLRSLFGDITMGDITADAVLAATLGLETMVFNDPFLQLGLILDQYSGSFRWFEYEGDILGSILSNGVVTANWLGMVSRYDMGTADAPIKTDVNIVTGYSYCAGDIFIDEANALEIGLYAPVYGDFFGDGDEDEDEGGEEIPAFLPLIEVGASLAARDGIVHVSSEGDMLVNSVIAPRGGVFLESRTGSIYAGTGWWPGISGETVGNAGEVLADLYEMIFHDTGDPELFGEVLASYLMDISDVGEEGLDYLTPVVFGIPMFEMGISAGPNVIAGGFSYFSAPEGTIGVGNFADPGAKDPDMSGGIEGIVRPGVTSVTGVVPSIAFDPLGLPSKNVLYNDMDTDYFGPLEGYEPALNEGPLQVWPETPLLGAEALVTDNPLKVCIQVLEGSKSAADVREDFTPQAGLTLNFSEKGGPEPEPEPPVIPLNQLSNPLMKEVLAYYEILNVYRLASFEPATPTTFFGYRPLTPTDTGAFDDLGLDAGAYEFISNNIRMNRPLSPYFVTEEDQKKKK
ncbi:MAG TPA: filamentous hemagglutinin N-terminal domain-containing protein [Candidatus Omnitrophota bacterium]|nr:filamentous hemagglutinin N-terminal domain-containing protein [Candidatus Omnitrophota bacterium]